MSGEKFKRNEGRTKMHVFNFTTGYVKAIQLMVIGPPTFTWFSILHLEGVNLT